MGFSGSHNLSRHSCNTRNLHIFIDALRRGGSLEMLRPISAFSFCVAKNLGVFRRGTFAKSVMRPLARFLAPHPYYCACAANSGGDDDSEEKPSSGCTGSKR